jgi:hypothetical protein
VSRVRRTVILERNQPPGLVWHSAGIKRAQRLATHAARSGHAHGTIDGTVAARSTV